MIIKLIPETEAEKSVMQEEELVGVRDFFIFGAKQEEEGMADFHNWRGNHRYLLSGLTYFYEVINDERREKNMVNAINKNSAKNKMKKTSPVDNKTEINQTAILEFPKSNVFDVNPNIIDLPDPKLPDPGFILDNNFTPEKE